MEYIRPHRYDADDYRRPDKMNPDEKLVQIVSRIKDYIKTTGTAPTITELVNLTGVSKQSIRNYAKEYALELSTPMKMGKKPLPALPRSVFARTG